MKIFPLIFFLFRPCGCFYRLSFIMLCSIIFFGKLSAATKTIKDNPPKFFCDPKMNRLLTDVYFSYFLPTSSTTRQIYNAGGLNYNISISILLFRNLYLWEGFDYFHKTGSSLNGAQRTSLTILPFTLGLKFIYPMGNYRIHLAGGGKYYFVFNRNESNYVDRKIDQNGLGGAVEFGFSRLFWKTIQISLFGNYSFIDLKKSKTSKPNVFLDRADLSGIYLGGGAGFSF